MNNKSLYYISMDIHKKNVNYCVKIVDGTIVETGSFARILIEAFVKNQRRLICALKKNPQLKKRVKLLQSVPGVGDITALTWALEIANPHRFSSIRKAVSYCSLCSAQRSSGGVEKRGPISKQRNAHLQWVLVEAAKMVPNRDAYMAELHEKELKKRNKNRATLNLARKIVAYLLAVDKSGKTFQFHKKRESKKSRKTVLKKKVTQCKTI